MKQKPRNGQRRKGPIRSGSDRRSLETAPPKFNRRDTERRAGDRRSGIERRSMSPQDMGQSSAAM